MIQSPGHGDPASRRTDLNGVGFRTLSRCVIAEPPPQARAPAYVMRRRNPQCGAVIKGADCERSSSNPLERETRSGRRPNE